jgi:hypothetical protein
MPTELNFNAFLKWKYKGWQVTRVWVFWPVYGWNAHCADCMMRDEFLRPLEDTFLYKMMRAEKAGFQGGTIVVPFQGPTL